MDRAGRRQYNVFSVAVLLASSCTDTSDAKFVPIFVLLKVLLHTVKGVIARPNRTELVDCCISLMACCDRICLSLF